MAKKFNMVSEHFPLLSANMANIGASTNNSNINRPVNQPNEASNLNRSRNNSDEFNSVYFNHNMSIRLNDHNFLLWKLQVQDQLLVSWLLSSNNDNTTTASTEQTPHALVTPALLLARTGTLTLVTPALLLARTGTLALVTPPLLLANDSSAATKKSPLILMPCKQGESLRFIYPRPISLPRFQELNNIAIKNVVATRNSKFSLKDLGDLHYFLGIEVQQTSSCLHLSQAKYIRDLLFKAQMRDAKPAPTPMTSGLRLLAYVSEPVQYPHLYRSIIGSLQYLVITRPEISFNVNKSLPVSCEIHN
uniref:Reverse transcriptase Ty1/copia-type domain-containing protein n=1 Tax=Cannabis sativa TaxID=3483 RepID=A0A803NMQ0_CANSA